MILLKYIKPQICFLTQLNISTFCVPKSCVAKIAVILTHDRAERGMGLFCIDVTDCFAFAFSKQFVTSNTE